MKKPFLLLLMLLWMAGSEAIAQNSGYVLVIHGGAGYITPDRYSPEIQSGFEQALAEALNAGEKILSKGGTSLDAVVAAIQVLEASPLFNSAKGAVFNAEGKNELDASVMDGKSGKAGAVAGVMTIKSPVEAARRVMDSSDHVMLSGRGAEEFARQQGLEIVDPAYFYTEESWQEYLKVKARMETNGRKGTVGAVALDKAGNLAAATSTGGMVYKKFGRIGDSPIIGAGTYANNESCAVSCTGHGEYFIRNAVAYDVSARMLYLGESITQATDYIINKKLKDQEAAGGLIALDKNGNIAMPFNTPGMFRGFVSEGKTKQVLMFK
ncbi:MAG: isoaspartyl peptidase/L-asparaginase [Lentimicrobiaceae bacterium]|jgi:beta-aspartyl-peptidase (threonine type)|nr:isoaspartyl peptidase/L-asparaginase [Lentimicrobiaceae bacterium]MDD4598893.1 isoaspartyl peptidase/L-asparaginase [Lentimicrobiaceae bacterium]MDY0026418.1 isoaspartyl peptidase/L-asparaginase [Lentimicrobium sp.]HAH60265.1 beta-aspartyl-peptidase [Bacteroidales bacterium]